MEREGLLIRTYGGAYCARLVEPGDTVFLDESTTCLAVARHLLDIDSITVVTNSLPIAQAFAEGGRGSLLLSGGELDRKNQCFVGGSAEEFLSRFYVDKSFISCRGVDRAAGITDGSAINGRIRAMMLGRARHCCLLVDHTKLGMASFFRIGDIRSVGTLIADSFPDEDLRDFFCRCGLTCVETMTGRVYGPDGK